MADLRAAAQAVLDRWDSPRWEWAQHGPTADLMAELRAALAQVEPVQYNDEPSGYESITPSYTRWVSPARYAKFADNVQRWYRPYWIPKETQQAERDALLCALSALGIRPMPNQQGRWLSKHRPGLNFPSAEAAAIDAAIGGGNG